MDRYQREAVERAIAGQTSLFITGGAGTGKTYIIKELTEIMEDQVILSAPTWSAAVHINGVSIHKAFGIHPSKLTDIRYDESGNIDLRWGSKYVRGLSYEDNIEMFIIDEISMVSGDALMYIDLALRKTFNFEQPFGGKQMIVVGDLSQLPPIKAMKYKYVFDSPIWKKVFTKDKIINLLVCHRQDEVAFLSALEQVRLGGKYDFFNSRIITEEEAEKILQEKPETTRISSRHVECDRINNKEIQDIPGDEISIVAFDIDTYGTIKSAHEQEGYSYMPVLKFKVGAKIILTRSIEPKRTFHNGKVLMIKEIKPMYAGSLMELLDRTAKQDISRYSSEKNAKIFNALQFNLMDNEFMRKFRVVVAETIDGQRIELKPMLQIKSIGGYIYGVRVQLPFVLGYAITIHRAQGMTLESEILYINDSFDSGMVYVALSRCQKLNNLYIVGRLPPISDLDIHIISYLTKIGVIME